MRIAWMPTAARSNARLVSAREMRQSAFTLVELMVVIGIISALVAILLPALRVARDRATSLKCLNTLRQIGLASLMYSNESRGKVPWFSSTGGPGTGGWQFMLTPYLARDPAYQTPGTYFKSPVWWCPL